MNELNDALDDLFAAPTGEVRQPVNAPESFKAKEAARAEGFYEACWKCGGSGSYRGPSQHGSRCFACQGKGGKTYKQPRAKRLAAKMQRAERKDAKKRAEIAEWIAANPEVHADIVAGAERGSDFARQMLDKLNHWGSLTDGQVAGIRRGMEKRAAAQTAAAERAANAPVADTAGVDRLKLAFDTAIQRARSKGRRFRWPKITIGCVVISPAGENSKNAGALYVKDGGQYLGKIAGGRFFASRECSDEQQARVLSFIADPKAAAEAYGIETGICCVCNAPLTNKASIERGIGPVCAEKMGW